MPGDIHREPHLDQHGRDAITPYDLALEFALESLTHFLDGQGEARLPIVADARGKREDNMLEQAFYRIMARGTPKVTAERFKRLDCELGFQSKKNNIVGVQVADLCAHPCARHILNPSRPNRAFDIARGHI